MPINMDKFLRLCVFISGFSLAATLKAADDIQIVLGSFSTLPRAETALVEFRAESDLPLEIQTIHLEGRSLYRLLAGNFSSRDEAEIHLAEIRQTRPDAWLDIRKPEMVRYRSASLVFGSFLTETLAQKEAAKLSADYNTEVTVLPHRRDGTLIYRVMTPATSHIPSVDAAAEVARQVHPGAWVIRSTEQVGSNTKLQLDLTPPTTDQRIVVSAPPSATEPLQPALQPVPQPAAEPTPPTENQPAPPPPPVSPPSPPPEPVTPEPVTQVVESTPPGEADRDVETATAPTLADAFPAPETKTRIIDSEAPRPKRTSSFVPPGFEDLLEPQTTQVDVYFGGVFLVSTLATYTPTEITLLLPDEVTPHMSDLLEPVTFTSLISGPMPTNASLVCFSANQTGCGEMVTEGVEVIFDENRFRMDLFVGPSLLAVRDVEIDKFLPPSTGGLAFLNQMNATVNGVESGRSNYNIGNSTTFSFKETRLLAISNFTKQEDFTIDTLALERQFAGRQYQAGYFRSSAAGMTFLTEQEFAGVTMSSSLDTRTDLDQSTGADLQVFLESRSRVDLLKDGRLISTAIYDAGNQIIDTSSLPSGAYDVVLRIRDSFGRIRQETRFYVKTNELPPVDGTIYFLDVGEVAQREEDSSLPETTGDSLFRAGISKRLTKSFGGQVGVMLQEDEEIYEVGVFKLGRSYELNFNVATGNEGDRGVNLSARFRSGPFTLNTNLRKTWIDEDRFDASLFGQETAQGSISLGMPLWGGTLSVTGRYNERGLAEADENYGFRYDFKSYSTGYTTFDTNLQVTKDNDDLQALLTFRLRLDRGHWRSEISSQYYYEDNELVDDPEDGFVNNLSTSWQDGDRFLADVNWNLRAIDDRDDDTLETDIEIISDYGQFQADALYSAETEKISYGGSFNTAFIANRGTFTFGGREQARAALVMDVKGDVDDAYFSVLVNGSPRGNARIGSKTVIGLQPFETYDVTLVPEGDSIVDFNNQVKTATLYPGNVVTMDWKASRVLVAFGQLVTPDGEPVTKVLIEGVTGLATTDDFGFFQAEIESDVRTITAKTRTSECTATLPEFSPEETVVMLEAAVCR